MAFIPPANVLQAAACKSVLTILYIFQPIFGANYVIQYFFVSALRKIKLGSVLQKMAVSCFEYIYIYIYIRISLES
jgi:hypothetical protein